MKALVQIIGYISEVSALPAIWIGRKSRSVLWFYVLISFSADMLQRYQHAVGDNTRYVNNAYYLIEFLLIGIYFALELFEGNTRKIMIGVILAIAILFVVRTVGIMREKTNWEDVALLDAIMIILCMTALYKVINNIEHVKIEHSPLFVFSASFLLYASACLMLMLFADHFRRVDPMVARQVWSIHNVFNILKNLAIARVFYLQLKARAT
jgi:hypothetical protein